MGKEYICVIDRGTTNTKTVLFDQDGNEVHVSSSPCPKPSVLHYGWCEQDMNVIWASAAEALRRCTAFLSAEDRIAGVTVTGQGSGAFLVDQKGNPVRAGIVSLDARAAELVENLRKDGTADWWFEHTHVNVNTASPLLLLYWLQRYEPENYRAVHKVLFSKDWIRFKLTGEYITDISDASPGAMVSADEKHYAVEIFEKLGMSDKIGVLPELRASYEFAGCVTEKAAEETGLEKGTPVFSGAHDMMACCFGVGRTDADFLLSLIGTWGANYMISTKRQGGISNPHMVPGYYVNGALDGNSGAVLDRMLSLLLARPGDSSFSANDYYALAEEWALNSRHKDLIFKPYLYGVVQDSSISGEFKNLRNWHEKEDLLYAVYEGIVMGHYRNSMTLEDSAQIRDIYLGGGGARSRLFGQLFADMFGRSVMIPEGEDLTARGAALAALYGTGIRGSLEDASIPVKVSKTYEPNEERHRQLMEKYHSFL